MKLLDKIVEIIYLPTLRCNCRCSHCGIRFDNIETEEMSCKMVANFLCASKNIVQDVVIQITGGEPFLKEDLNDFIISIINQFPSCKVSITTNGTFPHRIENLIKKIPKHYAGNIFYSISIDGLEYTHDKIRKFNGAFNLALQSANLISKHGLGLAINTVIHRENLEELSLFKHKIKELCDADIKINFIPICSDVALSQEFPYSDKEIETIFHYINDTPFYIKYIVSNGHIQAKDNCHAGERNVVILPQGHLYTCTFASSYSRMDANQYLIGSLGDNDFDEIWEGRGESSALQMAKGCTRCNNPCDINREKLYFGFSFELIEEEIKQYFKYSKSEAYWGDSWHSLEENGKSSHRWMANREATVYLANRQIHFSLIKISYLNSLPETYYGEPMLLDLFVNDIVYISQYIVKESETLTISLHNVKDVDFITIKFLVNHVWKPSEVLGSNDNRTLGIAVSKIEIC